MTDKVIFLDRDGVINVDIDDYVTTWEEFRFLPNTLEALKQLTRLGFEIYIISNQAGINRGLFTQRKLALITRKMLERIKESGGYISEVKYCVHRRDEDCPCRKPKTGLFKQVLLNKHVELDKVFMVGDTERDIEAGKNLGCRTILVLSGKTKRLEEASNFRSRPDFIAADLLEAVNKIISKNG